MPPPPPHPARSPASASQRVILGLVEVDSAQHAVAGGIVLARRCAAQALREPRAPPSHAAEVRVVMVVRLTEGRTTAWQVVDHVQRALYSAVVLRLAEANVPPSDLQVDVLFLDLCGDQLIRQLSPFVSCVYLAKQGEKPCQPFQALLQTITAKPESLPADPAVAEPAFVARDTELPQRSRHVALGGTFDHLHIGHKLLLTVSAWIATTVLICGIMDDDARLAKKTCGEHIEAFAMRRDHVRGFLDQCGPGRGLELRLEPIMDDYGPTRHDAAITAIVGSLETQQGCRRVNDIRAEAGLPPLDVYTVGVLSTATKDGSPSSDEALNAIAQKISSTAIRQLIDQRSAHAS
ncbi:hypothetical protein CXG81DRAFT_24847 [Caulochytrium protostelioides]|uniref:Cytidyltransferase-like domain-containing protein n=1 Tax=Caulochytrium protostelioides TaxID=1555241 RepID=A0A4P9XAR6_9FUNG|nr:hypothetical protein CXG81DRAFT_24847 [Caulochytrium protostelioides]|eukprot:RKP02474.1 hypothetical protein CXG81DRAFT_24847 [Caulochytrium protostelioides]